MRTDWKTQAQTWRFQPLARSAGHIEAGAWRVHPFDSISAVARREELSSVVYFLDCYTSFCDDFPLLDCAQRWGCGADIFDLQGLWIWDMTVDDSGERSVSVSGRCWLDGLHVEQKFLIYMSMYLSEDFRLQLDVLIERWKIRLFITAYVYKSPPLSSSAHESTVVR